MARAFEPLLRDDGTVVVPSCFVADRPWTRLRGLLGRTSVARGEAILLRPASAIHTCFMRFAIDVVFVDAAGKVVEIVPALRPWRFASRRGAQSVGELGAGEAAASGIDVGEVLAPAKGIHGVT